jgi:hypothetical protein
VTSATGVGAGISFSCRKLGRRISDSAAEGALPDGEGKLAVLRGRGGMAAGSTAATGVGEGEVGDGGEKVGRGVGKGVV